jgi:hypothetical protein
MTLTIQFFFDEFKNGLILMHVRDFVWQIYKEQPNLFGFPLLDKCSNFTVLNSD